jgi:hypothetical protein
MKLTAEQQSELVKEHELFIGDKMFHLEDSQFEKTLPNGRAYWVLIFEVLKNGKYMGKMATTYEFDGQDRYFKDCTAVKVECTEVVTVQYTRQDGKDW